MKTTEEIMEMVREFGFLQQAGGRDLGMDCLMSASQQFERSDAKFDEIRAALTASMGWHPMDSAPKDGEPVLVYKGDERRVGSYMTAAYWGEWPDCEDCWIAVGGKPLGYFSKLAGAPQGYPTHWMPLPPPPAEGSPA